MKLFTQNWHILYPVIILKCVVLCTFFNIFNKRRVWSLKAISVFACPFFYLFISVCLHGIWGLKRSVKWGQTQQNFQRQQKPTKQTFVQCVDQNGKNIFRCHGHLNCWRIQDFKTVNLSFFLLPVCSRWKREIWTHCLQGYYCPGPQWSWEWPGGYSQVSGCNRLTAWLSPLCWHTLWYFGSWQHAR